MFSSESLFELMLRVLRLFERSWEGIESREQEDKSNTSMVGAHLVIMMLMVVMVMVGAHLVIMVHWCLWWYLL